MNNMQEALSLAERGRFSVAPNPLVGCVIERGGEIVGRGWHKKAGLPHAEIEALRDAGDRARGATIYSTLEPCSHHGRTPPCVDALIAAHVKSVRIAMRDPNPCVNGQGIRKLRAAGIAVDVGEEENAARKQNEVFLHYTASKQPFVVAKWAMTVDGKIACDNGSAKWITGEAAREHARYSRCWLGAVAVGVGTIIADDPQLAPQLWRIVLDSRGRTPAHAAVLRAADSQKTLIATTEKSSMAWREAMCQKDIEILVLPENEQGRVDINSLLAALGKKEVTGLLVEGGQQVLTSFVTTKQINKIHAYIAPKLIGGHQFTPLRDIGIHDMGQALKGRYEKFEQIGDDIFLEMTPEWS